MDVLTLDMLRSFTLLAVVVLRMLLGLLCLPILEAPEGVKEYANTRNPIP